MTPLLSPGPLNLWVVSVAHNLVPHPSSNKVLYYSSYYFFNIVNADMIDWKRTYLVKTNFICYVLMLFLLFLYKIRDYRGT